MLASSLGARLSAQAQYNGFYRTETDSLGLDVVRLSSRLEGFGGNEKFTGRLSAEWMGDRYVKAQQLDRV
jgi:hypothetical protein